jgi:hypothetical protein
MSRTHTFSPPLRRYWCVVGLLYLLISKICEIPFFATSILNKLIISEMPGSHADESSGTSLIVFNR